MEPILSLDQSVFLFINHLPHTAVLNAAMSVLSGVGSAGIIWFVLGIFLILKEEKRDHWFFVPLLAAGIASWVITEKVLKPLVGRVRPALEMGAILVGKPSLDPSFPSGHVTIAFAMAVVLSSKEPRFKWFWYLLAILICFSRVYLGKHYPLDTAGGAAVGWGIGVISLVLYRRVVKRFGGLQAGN